MSSPEDNVFADYLAVLRDNPVKFVEEVLGVKPLEYQAELLMAVAKNERKISIRSGHGTGKSTAASWLMLWFLLTRYPVKIVVTAPTSSQLFDALFAETKRWVNELPDAWKQLLIVKSDRVELAAAPSEAFISCRVSRQENPEAMAGVHSDNVLLVVDEASGVPEAVFEAAGGSMSGHNAATVLLSNPTRSSGTFYETQTKLKDSWWTRRWSCQDSPLVSDDFVKEMEARYGSESSAFYVRVLGEFPRAEDDTIIPYHLVEAALKRDIRLRPDEPVIWGLDVALSGGDKSALCKRQGTIVTEIRTWQNLDLMELCGVVKAEFDALHDSKKPIEINVDVIGMGAGVCSRLQELGLPAIGINVSESPSMKQTYLNLRAELWFKAKAFLENRDCKLPEDDGLVAELVAPRYSFTSNGKMKAEGKQELKRRGIASPDRADSFCLTFAGDAIVALRGGGAASWAKPIRRNLQGVA